MPKLLSSEINIDPIVLTKLGAFDPLLDLDTHLFIDPHLLKYCTIPEFSEGYESLQQRFIKIAKLLTHSTNENDLFWKQADRLMQWGEVKGLCIGYSREGISGSGIGPELRRRLLITAKAIISAGINDPEIFELVGLLEGDVGPDRISDMTANIIKPGLIAFTKRVFNKISPDWTKSFELNPKTGLPKNPYAKDGADILLVPQSLLRDLPVALDWTDHDEIAAHNQQLRNSVNELIGDTWKQAVRSQKKDDLKRIVLGHPDLIRDLVDVYCNKPISPYDFNEDRAGAYLWYSSTQAIVKDNPLQLDLSKHPTIAEVEKLVLSICKKFKTLVEDNGLWKLFYNKGGGSKSEEAMQLVFYGVAEAYCEANGVMIARESNSGRGPVDFKFGTKRENSVLVEIKKSTNTSGLKRGIESQLPIYLASEKAKKAIYLIMDLMPMTQNAKENLQTIAKKIRGRPIQIIHVDAMKKASASKKNKPK